MFRFVFGFFSPSFIFVIFYRKHGSIVKLIRSVRESGGCFTPLWPVYSSDILSVSVPGVRSEVLLHALEDEGIYVSAGSACSSHQMKKTHGTPTLRAMGLDEAMLDSTVRFSLSRENTEEEMRETAAVVSAIVPKLRRFS